MKPRVCREFLVLDNDIVYGPWIVLYWDGETGGQRRWRAPSWRVAYTTALRIARRQGRDS